ncbi:MAG: hypothetical protein EBZ24_05160 [Synechococcaceae bacterium WB9_4xB_025]|nr:hypothetical protein [Synechococcaceae bacterium WB9_4xB_025]
MARAQSQFLRIYDAAGITYQRWQNFYSNVIVTWDSASWAYVAFTASGVASGVTGDEGGISLTLPATGVVVQAVDLAMEQARLFEVKTYEFDPVADGVSSPPAGQTLISTFLGEITSASEANFEFTLQLGSSLSPIGAQIPPRTLTNDLIGSGMQF